jgi:hypothetical protein
MKKNKGDKPFGVIIHTWKYHKETPYVATFIPTSKNVIFFFFPLQNWRIGKWNRSSRWGWYQWEAGGGGKRV